MRVKNILSWVFLVLLCASCVSYTTVADSDPSYTHKQISEDFTAFMSFVRETHPDIQYSATIEELTKAEETVLASLKQSMTVRDAWMAMALINPYFKDAHVGVRRPVAALETYQSDGGLLYPGSVVVGDGGSLLVGPVNPNTGLSTGDRIVSINGVRAEDILATIKPRMRGETEKLRQLLVERYFPEYFWIAYGGFDAYTVRVERNGRARTVKLKDSQQGKTIGEEDLWSYSVMRGNVGYLNVTTFGIEHRDAFEEFLSSAFSQIKADSVGKLIIDLRENGGGARDLSDLLMGYLTAEPYSAISSVKARVTEQNIGLIPGATLGSVVTMPFQQLVTPADNPLRFDGEIYVIIGAQTYSQAIVFAATLQDYSIATIAGEETEGPANQTGQVQLFTMPNTGIEGLSPIYIFTRASGDTSRSGVIPDVHIRNEPLDPMGSVDALIEVIIR
ncbi:S41 family peptidase [Hyphococcus flavus]|uniref:S41 family peptidase n=1 Tax=Hyphococcus flavus TaxID=1866326 RepID=A0AAF0CH68_9PROT|nr:S41 family peptidase [Hyphococcus flavus]WDI33254.1 S41 family peptidase [Hyphococcus flavus]